MRDGRRGSQAALPPARDSTSHRLLSVVAAMIEPRSASDDSKRWATESRNSRTPLASAPAIKSGSSRVDSASSSATASSRCVVSVIRTRVRATAGAATAGRAVATASKTCVAPPRPARRLPPKSLPTGAAGVTAGSRSGRSRSSPFKRRSEVAAAGRGGTRPGPPPDRFRSRRREVASKETMRPGAAFADTGSIPDAAHTGTDATGRRAPAAAS